jgi:hypothetical protein
MDSVPEVVRQAALHAFDLRVAGARIADLVFDPLVDYEKPPASVSNERVLHFSTGDQSVIVAVTRLDHSLRLTVALAPSREAAVQLRTTTDSWSLKADDAGRLTVDGVPSGLISLVIKRGDEAPVQTAWVRV